MSDKNTMTAQAGAVAACPFCGEPLKTVSVSEGSTFRWRKVDGCCADGPEVRHDTTADDQAAAELESTRKAIAAWNERPTPPAAVSVEALGTIVPRLRGLAGVIRKHGICAPLALDEIADELTQLIKGAQQWLTSSRPSSRPTTCSTTTK